MAVVGVADDHRWELELLRLMRVSMGVVVERVCPGVHHRGECITLPGRASLSNLLDCCKRASRVGLVEGVAADLVHAEGDEVEVVAAIFILPAQPVPDLDEVDELSLSV